MYEFSGINPPIIALMGVTATGKTALAIELAQHLHCDVISIDSAMIYRGMDIGSATPTLIEQQGVRHHLVDHIEVDQTYSVAQCVNDVKALVQQQQQQGKPSLLVGGTMLYFSALLHGLSQLPPTPEPIRQRLYQEAERFGPGYLHQQLQHVDSASAARLHPQDLQRIVRALAVWEVSGEPLSKHQGKRQAALPPCITFSLLPEDREAHRVLLRKRFALMIKQGFEQEMEHLFHHPYLNRDSASMRCVGYRQWWDYLAGDSSREEAIERSINATSQLAKRQRTWLNQFSDSQRLFSERLQLSDLLSHLSRSSTTLD